MVTDGDLFEVLASFLEEPDEIICDTSSESASDIDESNTNQIEINLPQQSPGDEKSIRLHNKVAQLKKTLAKKGKHIRPRTIQSDIRESYGAMFANTFNSCDMTLIGGMCERFYMPNLSVMVRKQIGNEPKLFTTRGIGPMFIANLIYSASVLSPDVLTTLKHSFFKNTSGEVSFTFYFCSSKVYNVPSILEVLPNMVVEKEQACGLTEDDKLSDDVIVKSLERIKVNLPLRKKPVKVVCKCVVKMVTNALKRVELFTMSVYNVENDFRVEM